MFLQQPPATFVQKVSEAITFCRDTSACEEFKLYLLKFLTRRGVVIIPLRCVNFLLYFKKLTQLRMSQALKSVLVCGRVLT